MENWLFRAAMPYCVIIENGKIIVQNRKYRNLFEGYFKLPLSAKIYERILNDIAYSFDEQFSIDGGKFWLFDDSTIPLTPRDMDKKLLAQYYIRLTALLDLCDGVSYTDNNPLLGMDPEKDELNAQIREKDAQIASLHEIIKQLSKKG